MPAAAQFVSIFLAACAANSFISWLALQNRWGGNIAKFFYCSLTLLILFSLIFDDGVKAVVKVESFTYYTTIGVVFFSALVGGTLIWISL
jgi:hypothetical protein